MRPSDDELFAILARHAAGEGARVPSLIAQLEEANGALG
jgi:hypothetical protein